MKVLLILGNGFSMDFVKSCLPETSNVDTANLFAKGAEVPAPTGNPYGFLSAKHTPALWALNARPFSGRDESLRIIEDILSSVQTYFAHGKKSAFFDASGSPISTYLKAYCELAYYLRALFIKYDKQKNFANTDKWAWAIFLKKLSTSNSVSEIIIVTYNYDLWLERVLEKLGISYRYANEDSDKSSKFLIYKPHGSINFVPKNSNIDASIERTISYTLQEEDIPKNISPIKDEFDKYWNKYTLIPPAANPEHVKAGWNEALKKSLADLLKSSDDNVTTIICGLSYWYVDRREIDEILCAINPESEVLMINPRPPSSLDAVLTTLFKNYSCSPSCEVLSEVENEL